MERNALAEMGERLGFFAYMTVMGGGRPFWPALFDGPKAVTDLTTPSRPSRDSAPERGPLANTGPYQYRVDHENTSAA